MLAALATFLLVGLHAPFASAATYYVSPLGSDTAGDGSSANPWRTLGSKAFSVGGGNTFILEDGTYDYAGSEIGTGNVGDVPSGSAGAYTVIKAQHDGGAVITTSLNMLSASYVQIEGIKFKYPDIKQVTGPADGSAPSHHIKFLRCAFQGGTTTATNSHNFYFSYSNHLLMEDCWAYGLGGRYTVATQSASEIVLRRVVVRKDGGWPGESNGDPEAALTIYNSSNVLLQNVLVIDSQAAYSPYWMSSLFLVNNTATSSHISDSITANGTIILNGEDRGVMITEGVSNVTLDNVSIANIKNGPNNIARYIHTKGVTNLTVNRTSILQYPAGPANSQYGMYLDGGVGSAAATTVAGLASGTDYNGIASTDSDSFGNASSHAQYSYNPYANGLLYLTRTEGQSTLNTAGIGAQQITTALGTSGTFWGDPNYNTDTGVPLWPWPNEDRIKADMASVSARGFAANGNGLYGGPITLTSYVWEALGNPLPAGIYTPADVTPPSVSITSPLPGSSVNGTVSVSVTGSDNVGVTKVEFYVNGVLQGIDATSPYLFSWNTSALAAGTYTLTAKAYDAANNVGQSTAVTVSVFSDTTPPVVAISQPASAATVSGTVAVSASASDNVGVSKVEFYANSTLLAAVNVAPYTFNWNTSLFSNGNYTLTAKAYDAAGNVGLSSRSVTVFNDTIAPTVTIAAPIAGSKLSGTVSVSVNASDNVGVTKVALYVNNVLQASNTSAPYTFSWNTTSVANGTYTMTAKAYDAAGNVGNSSSVTVTVSNNSNNSKKK